MRLRSPATNFVLNLKQSDYTDGHLSLSYGFFPTRDPYIAFPLSHQALNDAMKSIPVEIQKPSFRKFVCEIPQASIQDLPDEFLPLAATFYAVVAHAYWNCRATTQKPELPANIKAPWEEVSKRLNRSSLNMDIVDLFINNWYVFDQSLPEAQRYQVENMAVIIPTFANQAERIFYLTFVEMTYRTHRIVQIISEAHDAVVNQDNELLTLAILDILKLLDTLAAGLLKADINPNSKTFLDPLMLTKTTSFFGVPANGATSTVSGAFSPIFLLLDIILGRTQFESEIGKQIQGSFRYIPKVYQDFIAAVRKVSIKDYVERSNNEGLRSLYSQTLTRYAGKGGLLALHRDKAAYGVLNVGTRVGRIETVAGLVTNQKKPWVAISDTLDESRHERPAPLSRIVFHKETVSDNQQARTTGVSLKAESHIYYTAGDHVKILPTNDAQAIESILTSLAASKNEILPETPLWKSFIDGSLCEAATEGFTLHALLQYGNITQLSKDKIEEVLPGIQVSLLDKHHKISLSHLIQLIESKQPEVMKELKDNLVHLVVPLAKRSYSISSPSSHQYVSSGCPFAMDLTVSRATYSSPVMTDQDQRLNGKGVASQFLTSSSIAPAAGIPATIHPSHRFRLPEDRTKPVILIAMGSGIASFKAFYRQNAAENEGRSIHLFYGVKKHTDVVAPRELAAIAKSSPFKYEIATSAEGHKKRITQVIAESYAPFMLEMMNSDACFYICGNTEFIRDVQQAMISIIANSQLDKSPAAVIQAEKFFYRHVAPGRFFTQEFYTNAVADHYPKLPVTQISLHNNTLQGYWVIINNSVYDVTNYLQIHPGGHYLIQLNAGIDATAEFAGVHAHVDSAHALQMAQRYKIGEVEQPVWQDAETQEAYTKLTTFLSALTAYQNLMAIDYFITGTADYYWLLKALEAHQRFENFVKSTILPGLENLNSILKELNNDFIKPLLLKFRACFDQSFPYERDLFGEVINSKDSDVKITHNVYGFFSKVYQTDAQLLAELKSGIIASTDKLTPSKCLKAKL